MTWIDKLFGKRAEEPLENNRITPELADVLQPLASLDPAKAPYVACLALLSARLAGADLEISTGEKQRIVKVLHEQTQLSVAEAEATVEIASAKELANSIKHNRITELLNELATVEQKREIIRSLFYIACDDDISEVESEKIRAISKALLVSNSEYINIRSEFSQHRSILKKSLS